MSKPLILRLYTTSVGILLDYHIMDLFPTKTCKAGRIYLSQVLLESFLGLGAVATTCPAFTAEVPLQQYVEMDLTPPAPLIEIVCFLSANPHKDVYIRMHICMEAVG